MNHHQRTEDTTAYMKPDLINVKHSMPICNRKGSIQIVSTYIYVKVYVHTSTHIQLQNLQKVDAPGAISEGLIEEPLPASKEVLGLEMGPSHPRRWGLFASCIA